MPPDITILRLPLPFHMGQVNCYLMRTSSGHILIDTGGSHARKDLLGQLEIAGCLPGSLRLAILTHGDFDHIGNAAYLQSAFKASIGMHRDDAGMAERGDMFLNRKKPNALIRILIPLLSGFGASERFSPDALLADGFSLFPFGFEARIICLPGHSRGSIGVLTSMGDLFCGDLFENTSVPVLNPIMDDPAAARVSASKLDRLKVGMVYPGHGQPFPMEQIARGIPSGGPKNR